MTESPDGGWLSRLDPDDQQRHLGLMMEFLQLTKQINESGALVLHERDLAVAMGNDPHAAISFFRGVTATQRKIAGYQARCIEITEEIDGILTRNFGEPPDG